MKKMTDNRVLPVLCFVLALVFAGSCELSAQTKSGKAGRSTEKNELKAAEQKQQDQILRDEVMGFVKTGFARDAGEGWLFLARHYRELREPERSMTYLRTLLRSDNISPALTWEALLLSADIFNDRKEYAAALKELDRLIAMSPARHFMVRAKLARAKILGRSLTGINDLFAAFKRYFKPFPEKPDVEALEYLMGFERGYDLEIAMRALTAWEEIAAFPESAASSLANLHIAMLYAFDLNNPGRALPFIARTASDKADQVDAAFVRAVIEHFYVKDAAAE
jgi:tetratricopeptide (TPR) repeat protein